MRNLQNALRRATPPLSILLLCLGTPTVPAAQQPPAADAEAAYEKTIRERADNIVATLGIDDPSRSMRVSAIIARQYRDLRDVHAARNATPPAKPEETEANLAALHQAYLAALAVELTPEQIEKVKDGMTYGVLPLTFRVYQEMLPDLTAEQKAQILAWLTKARERAMDGGTSKEKHAWFGKYKGRINNYLSAAGYDMKKAEREMMERKKTAAPPP